MQETGGHTRPPVFYASAVRLPSGRSTLHVPERICESLAARIQAPAIPTGASLLHSSPDRWGIATARTKPLTRLMSNSRQPSTPRPWRATQSPTLQPRRFVNSNKKRLRFMLEWCRIMAPRQIKGRTWSVPAPHAPMRETGPPTQQCITVPIPIIAEISRHFKGACVCIYAVWVKILRRFVFASMGKPVGAGMEVPPPEAVPLRQKL